MTPTMVYGSALRFRVRMRGGQPKRPYLHEALSTIYAGLGRRDQQAASLRTAYDLYQAQGDTVLIDSFRRLTAATNLLLMGDRSAASDTLALILADSNAFFFTRAAVAIDPFWLKLKGEKSFERALAGR